MVSYQLLQVLELSGGYHVANIYIFTEETIMKDIELFTALEAEKGKSRGGRWYSPTYLLPKSLSPLPR